MVHHIRGTGKCGPFYLTLGIWKKEKRKRPTSHNPSEELIPITSNLPLGPTPKKLQLCLGIPCWDPGGKPFRSDHSILRPRLVEQHGCCPACPLPHVYSELSHHGSWFSPENCGHCRKSTVANVSGVWTPRESSNKALRASDNV